MSGHSKWSTIKHKKGKTDAQRGKIFTKIGREIAVAVKEGGSDPVANSKLRDAIAKAKAVNMPNDNIERSIKKAAGELNAINFEEITYEGYGAGGIAVICEALTDSRNRTASDVRHVFDRFGGNLGSSGCVSYMFDRLGILIIDASGKKADDVMMDALEAGADNFEEIDGVFEITCDPTAFSPVREALGAKYAFASAAIEWVPQNTTAPEGENLERFLKLIDWLEDLDDVQAVYHAAELPEEPEDD